MTPSILRPAERRRIPVLETLHGFKPWCTNQILYSRGKPCERCRGGNHWKAAIAGCVHGSHAKSAVGALEAYLHDYLGAYRAVSLRIAPSQFVYDMALRFGVGTHELRVLAHGLKAAAPDVGVQWRTDAKGEPFCLYVGRLSVEKGVADLPNVARGLGNLPLHIVGDGPLLAQLSKAAKEITNLIVHGRLGDLEVEEMRRNASVVLVPSRFYEHFCYSAAEALLDESCVVASRIGAIPELVEHEVTGQLVDPGDVRGMIASIRRAIEDPAAKSWAAAGRQRVLNRSNPAQHVQGLLSIYEEAIEMSHASGRSRACVDVARERFGRSWQAPVGVPISQAQASGPEAG